MEEAAEFRFELILVVSVGFVGVIVVGTAGGVFFGAVGGGGGGAGFCVVKEGGALSG